MVYSNHVVAAIKVDGKVLREQGNSVLIPFGSEYSILLKNLNSRRIQVKVSIDGTDATSGTWLIIEPNSNLELERFINNGNLEKGNRFKFIERTGAVEDHRGIKAEDGLIRIEYKREREKVEVPIIHYTHHYNYYDWLYYWKYHWPNYWYENPITYTPTSGGLASGVNCSVGSQANQNTQSQNAIHTAGMMGMLRSAEPSGDPGITVAGSESNQKFVSGPYFPVEDKSEVIVLQLKGIVKGKQVKKAVTVNQKLTCSTCGKKNKATNQFCATCGTALNLI